MGNLSYEAVAGDGFSIFFRTNKHVILVRQKIQSGNRKVSFKYIPLARAGKELVKIIGQTLDEKYFLSVAQRIKEMNGQAEISLHIITEDFGAGVFFDKTSLI